MLGTPSIEHKSGSSHCGKKKKRGRSGACGEKFAELWPESGVYVSCAHQYRNIRCILYVYVVTDYTLTAFTEESRGWGR